MRPGAPETEGDLGRRMTEFVEDLQSTLCSSLEAEDGGATFRDDVWERPGGGGGRTRVLEGGTVFEKAGVNFSDVHGEFSEEFARQVPGAGRQFTACGLSLVFHPRSPMVPTVHANFRYLTVGRPAGEQHVEKALPRRRKASGRRELVH